MDHQQGARTVRGAARLGIALNKKSLRMSASLALVGILGALLVGAISPGPSFVLVSRIAVKMSRKDGLAAALGMGIGGRSSRPWHCLVS